MQFREVRRIRKLAHRGASQAALAAHYGVTQGSISQIVSGFRGKRPKEKPKPRKLRRGVLTYDQIRALKQELKTAVWGQQNLIAARYGLSAAMVSRIKRGECWADI